MKLKFQYFLNQHSNIYLEKDERQALRTRKHYIQIFLDNSIGIFMRYPCLKIMSVFHITLNDNVTVARLSTSNADIIKHNNKIQVCRCYRFSRSPTSSSTYASIRSCTYIFKTYKDTKYALVKIIDWSEGQIFR